MKRLVGCVEGLHEEAGVTNNCGERQTVEDVVELLPNRKAHALPEALLALRDEGPVSIVLLPPVNISRLVVALFWFLVLHLEG